MMPWTISAICLGPSCNEQGSHYFMSLMMGRWLLHDQWTELPMPHNVVTHVGHMGHAQGMPKSLTFADWYGFELLDEADDVNDDHDSDFDPADDDVSYSSCDDDSAPGDDFAQPLLGLPAGVDNYNHNHDDYNWNDSQHSNDESNHSNDVSSSEDDDDDSNVDEDDDDDEEDNDEDDNNDNGGDDDDDDDNNNSDQQPPEINVPNVVISSPPASPCKNAGVGGENTGVQGQNTNPINNDALGHGPNNNMPEPDNSNEQDDLSQAMDL